MFYLCSVEGCLNSVSIVRGKPTGSKCWAHRKREARADDDCAPRFIAPVLRKKSKWGRLADAALEYAEASAEDEGVPDLLVGYRSLTYLLEVKNGKGEITDQQARFYRLWRGLPVEVVRTPVEAMRAIGALTKGGPSR